MSQPCALETCKRVSRALCQCCDKYLCREHFIEHDDLLNSKLNPLVNQINELADRIIGFDVDKMISYSLGKLNQWRDDCHLMIENYYKQKCEELDRCMDEILVKQREEITKLRFQISELIDKQETTHENIKLITLLINNSKYKMNEIEQMSIKINLCPLIINYNLINFKISKPHQLNLVALSSPYYIINRSNKSSMALANNDRYLLIHQNSNLCLIDNEGKSFFC